MGYTFNYPSYDTITTPDSSQEILNSFNVTAGLLIFLGVILLFVAVVAIVFYIFQAIGINKMMKRLNLTNSWIAYIPYLNIFAFGKVAEQYIKQDGKKSAKFSVILIIMSVANLIISFISLPFLLLNNLDGGASLVFILINLAISFAQFLIAFAYKIVFYIALWRIFAIFSNNNSTLFLILSILLPVQPFLIFGCRNGDISCAAVPVEENYTVENQYI